MNKQIHMALLNEGITVWRPVSAWQIAPETFIVLRPDDYDPDFERWEFPPGSTVICESRQTAEGTTLVAVHLVHSHRQTA